MNTHWLERVSPCLRPALSGEMIPYHTGHCSTPPNWVEPLRVIYDHELVLFSEGCYLVEIEGKEYSCPKDSFIIVPCGRPHASWSRREARGHRYWTHFDWVWQGPYGDTPITTYRPAEPNPVRYRYAPHFVPPQPLHGPVAAPQRVYELAERLCTLQKGASAHDGLISRAILLEILVELLAPDTAHPSTEREDELAGRVRNLLEQAVHLHRETPPIQDMLSSMGYSYAHLCRVFHRMYGVPPLKYVHLLRISQAKLLLRDTDLAVGEIAHRAGFDDAGYFTKLFGRVVGNTPSAYRKGNGGSDGGL